MANDIDSICRQHKNDIGIIIRFNERGKATAQTKCRIGQMRGIAEGWHLHHHYANQLNIEKEICLKMSSIHSRL